MVVCYDLKCLGDQFYFMLKVGNGEMLLFSECYISRQNVLNGIELVCENVLLDMCYMCRNVINGVLMFNLKVVNSQIIGISEMYLLVIVCEVGIQLVKMSVFGVMVNDFI